MKNPALKGDGYLRSSVELHSKERGTRVQEGITS